MSGAFAVRESGSIRCPICNRVIMRKVEAFGSHFRYHVKRGEMTHEESLAFRIEHFPGGDVIKQRRLEAAERKKNL